MIAIKKTHAKILLFCALILIFILGFLTHSVVHRTKSNFASKSSRNEDRIYDKKLQFVNLLLECKEESTSELKSFQEDIEKIVTKLKNEDSASDISVYFREMNNGLWFDINGDADFSPASLLKMPLMIAYLREAELNPKILSDVLTFTQNEDLNEKQNIKPEVVLELGKQYSIKDLIGRMIIYSDNSAQALLMKNANYFWQKPFLDLGINLPKNENAENFMSVIEYARFFRILYNASYVNKYYSNLALGILAESKFKDGIAASVPSDIAVAHKFGERVIGDVKQLHDCGIIYHPDTPYLLCIMTRGDNFEELTLSIQEVAKEVYRNIESQKK